MSYSCNKCGKFLFAPGRCSRCAAPETLVRTKSELEVITAERDRLAAENAELRRSERRLMDHQERIGAALAAANANATLDALREAVPFREMETFCMDCQEVTYFDSENYCKCCGRYQVHYEQTKQLMDLLYPQPKETTDDER